jgi:hypothetical protein
MSTAKPAGKSDLMRNLARPLSNPVISLCSGHGSADFEELGLFPPFEFKYVIFTSLGREGVEGVTSESCGGEAARSAEDEEDEARMLFRSERSARLVGRRLPPMSNALTAPLDLGSRL